MEELADIFKALSNSHRLFIFQELLHREGFRVREGHSCCGRHDGRCCVGELGRVVDLAPSTISHHIKELKNAGLINIDKQGSFLYCTVNWDIWQKVVDFFGQ